MPRRLYLLCCVHWRCPRPRGKEPDYLPTIRYTGRRLNGVPGTPRHTPPHTATRLLFTDTSMATTMLQAQLALSAVLSATLTVASPAPPHAPSPVSWLGALPDPSKADFGLPRLAGTHRVTVYNTTTPVRCPAQRLHPHAVGLRVCCCTECSSRCHANE